MTESKIYDVTIIGGGPSGLFGLFYAALRDMDALLIDSLPELGGQLVALYPEKDVYDVPGFPRILARDLAEQFAEQATMHRKEDIVLGERVETLERTEPTGIFQLETNKGRLISTRTVVITAGPGAFSPNKLAIPDHDTLEERLVHYFVREKKQFADKRVVIVGGGDSAFDWVINLKPVAREITLVHRRDVFRAHEDSVAKVNAMTDVQKHLFYEVKEISLTEAGEIDHVRIESNRGMDPMMLPADAVLVNIGFAASIGPIKNWGLDLKGNSIIVNQRMETNIPGVYAAGDVATFPGKLKLIATGTGEAATAVNMAKHFIDPTQREQPVHSTTLFEKKKPATSSKAEV